MEPKIESHIELERCTRQRKKDNEFETWSERSLFRTGALCAIAKKIEKYKIDILVVQETELLAIFYFKKKFLIEDEHKIFIPDLAYTSWKMKKSKKIVDRTVFPVVLKDLIYGIYVIIVENEGRTISQSNIQAIFLWGSFQQGGSIHF